MKKYDKLFRNTESIHLVVITGRNSNELGNYFLSSQKLSSQHSVKSFYKKKVGGGVRPPRPNIFLRIVKVMKKYFSVFS